VGVRISGQQGGLEKQQADAPDGRGAPKPGQEKPAQDGLNLEQQKGAQEDRYGEENPGHRDRLYHGRNW
jgi:hypothetical protein